MINTLSGYIDTPTHTSSREFSFSENQKRSIHRAAMENEKPTPDTPTQEPSSSKPTSAPSNASKVSSLPLCPLLFLVYVLILLSMFKLALSLWFCLFTCRVTRGRLVKNQSWRPPRLPKTLPIQFPVLISWVFVFWHLKSLVRFNCSRMSLWWFFMCCYWFSVVNLFYLVRNWKGFLSGFCFMVEIELIFRFVFEGLMLFCHFWFMKMGFSQSWSWILLRFWKALIGCRLIGFISDYFVLSVVEMSVLVSCPSLVYSGFCLTALLLFCICCPVDLGFVLCFLGHQCVANYLSWYSWWLKVSNSEEHFYGSCFVLSWAMIVFYT